MALAKKIEKCDLNFDRFEVHCSRSDLELSMAFAEKIHENNTKKGVSKPVLGDFLFSRML